MGSRLALLQFSLGVGFSSGRRQGRIVYSLIADDRYEHSTCNLRIASLLQKDGEHTLRGGTPFLLAGTGSTRCHRIRSLLLQQLLSYGAQRLGRSAIPCKKQFTKNARFGARTYLIFILILTLVNDI